MGLVQPLTLPNAQTRTVVSPILMDGASAGAPAAPKLEHGDEVFAGWGDVRILMLMGVMLTGLMGACTHYGWPLSARARSQILSQALALLAALVTVPAMADEALDDSLRALIKKHNPAKLPGVAPCVKRSVRTA